MDSIRSKYAVLFGFNDELRKIVESVFGDHRHPQNLREGYAIFALGKAYKTHAAVLILCEQGYGEDAAVVARTIFELSIYAPYIANDQTDATAQKYFEFDYVIRHRKYLESLENEDIRKEFEKRIAADPTVKEKLDEMAREAERVKAGYTEEELRRGWSGKTIKTMAKEVGRGDLYQTAYSLQSELAHSSVTTTNEYVSEVGDVLSMNIAPNENWVERTLVLSIDAFLGVVEVWNNVYGLGLEKQLQDFTARYVAEMKGKSPATFPSKT